MPATRNISTDTLVLDAVRRVVADDERQSHASRASSVMRSIAAQKAGDALAGRETDPEDNWALLLSALGRGAL